MRKTQGVATWSPLRALLASVDDRLTLGWAELDALVGGLPPSAYHHGAFWSGERTGWPGFRTEQVQVGRSVTFVRHSTATPAVSAAPAAKQAVDHRLGKAEKTAADLLLIGCVKTKQDHPARAAELFVSPLFVSRRRYAERAELPWYILSAKYGLLAPDDVVGPYDVYLADQPRIYRQAWGQFVAAQLAASYGDLGGRLVEVHAGAAYVDPLRGPLSDLGARLVTPVGHLTMGEQLAWYGNIHPVEQPTNVGHQRRLDELAAMTAALADPMRAQTPVEFLASDRRTLNRPGLYSWWVDPAGARDLAAGLGHPVAPGLIYAGQAGATRWPSGRRSANTLWTRIAGMHLGGRAEFSTFRRTLAAALRGVLGLAHEDAQELDAWIAKHLRVIAIPVDDPDHLGHVEDTVLDALDPPLNLRGRPPTPVRTRLQELRRTAATHETPM